MKKYDKEALKKAFDIPDPQHKEEFLDQLNIKKNNSKRHIPIFMRYASMAAFTAIMVSIVTNLSLTADFPDQFISDKTIIPTDSTSVVSSAATSAATEEAPTASTTVTVNGEQIIIQTTVSAVESEIITATATYEVSAETTVVESSESPPTTIAAVPTNTAETHTAATTVKTNTTKITQQTTSTKTTTQTVQLEPEPVTTTINKPLTTTPKTTKTSPPTTASHDNNIQTTFDPPPIATTKTTVVDSSIWTTATATVPSVDCPSDNDLTVRPTTVYTPSYMIIDKFEFDSENGLTDGKSPPTNSTDTSTDIMTEKLFNDSAFIFRGIIEEKIYTDISGQPYTIENIVITDIPKSQNSFYNINDKISIYVPGGYIPVHIYAEANNVTCNYPDNYMIYSDGGNKSTQNVGEEYFFFLNYGTDDMPYGAFQLTTNNDISVFRIDGYDIFSLGNSDLTFPFFGRLP